MQVRKATPGQELDLATEGEIIVRAVCATKLPTLTFDDNNRFRALLGDLFPGAPPWKQGSPAASAAPVKHGLESGTLPELLRVVSMLTCALLLGLAQASRSPTLRTPTWRRPSTPWPPP